MHLNSDILNHIFYDILVVNYDSNGNNWIIGVTYGSQKGMSYKVVWVVDTDRVFCYKSIMYPSLFTLKVTDIQNNLVSVTWKSIFSIIEKNKELCSYHEFSGFQLFKNIDFRTNYSHVSIT